MFLRLNPNFFKCFLYSLILFQGLCVSVHPSLFPENIDKLVHTAHTYAETNARIKAIDVARLCSEADVVFAFDTVVALDDRILEKPRV